MRRPMHLGPWSGSTGHDAYAAPSRVVMAAYVVLLIIPTQVVLVGPLRSNGAPARLLGLVALLMMVVTFLSSVRRPAMRAGGRLALVFLVLQVAVWAMAHRAPRTELESAGIDRALLIPAAGAGIAILCSIAVQNRDTIERLAVVLVTGAAFSSTIGIIQAFSSFGPLSGYLVTPVTTLLRDSSIFSLRGDVQRVSGAAGHPIEFAVVLAMVLPVGLSMAALAATRLRRLTSAACCAIIMVGFPFGVSRAGLLVVVVGIVIYALFLRFREGSLLLAVGALAPGVVLVVSPDIFAAFSDSITGAATDNSITGRLDDYPAAFARIAAAPWFGGAPQDPTVTVGVLDNQWLGTLVDSGVLGTVAMGVLLFGGAAAAGVAALRAADRRDRTLNGAIAASILGAALAAFTFDLFAFPQVYLLVFSLLGLVGHTTGTSRPSLAIGTKKRPGDKHIEHPGVAGISAESAGGSTAPEHPTGRHRARSEQPLP